MVYINKDVQNVYVELDEALDKANNYIGEQGSFDDFLKGAWVEITGEQYYFHQINLDATVQEVLDMKVYEPSEEELLFTARYNTINNIELYNTSNEVNIFYINNIADWFDNVKRSDFRGSLEDASFLGETEILFPCNAGIFRIDIQEAKLYLAKISKYANDCQLITEFHKATVNQISDIANVEHYDFTLGYPAKLQFDLGEPLKTLSI